MGTFQNLNTNYARMKDYSFGHNSFVERSYFMEFFSRNNVQNYQEEVMEWQGVYTVLYLYIILLVGGNFVTFRRELVLCIITQ